MKKMFFFVLVISMLISCVPQNNVLENTPVSPTETITPSTSTTTFTPSPTDTPLPTDTPSPIPASCAVPLNPTNNATIPASGPFDFTWAPFDGATSYVIAIGPSGWYPTNFPVTGTVLTRYMEIFPQSSSYQWSITALNSSGQEICRTEPLKFMTSASQYATPSFADSGNLQVINTLQSNSQEANTSDQMPHQDFKFTSFQAQDSGCTLWASVTVETSYPVSKSVVRYTTDPNEAASSDFCFWGPNFILGTTDNKGYGGSQNFSSPYIKNGDVIYLIAMFIYEQGVTGCTQVIQHTLTSCASN